jgi:hypothetical protein
MEEITIILAASGCDLPAPEVISIHGCEVQELYEVANSEGGWAQAILQIAGPVREVAQAMMSLMGMSEVEIDIAGRKFRSRGHTAEETRKLLDHFVAALSELEKQLGHRVEIRPLTREPGQKD